jgi:hypothetical protein
MQFIAASIRLYRAAAIILSIAALLGPAIWNGFPLIFADNGGYLERAFDGTLELGRSALYGTFLAAGMPPQFWPNVCIQVASRRPANALRRQGVLLATHRRPEGDFHRRLTLAARGMA